MQDAKKAMEAKQAEIKKQIGTHRTGFDNELSYNYMALQIFDLLSLYFCCDGYANENDFKEYAIAPVRVSYDNGETVKLTIKPNGPGSVVFDPYPFDISPLQVSARTRIVAPPAEKSEAACIDAYHKAARELLTFQISA